MFTKVRTRTDGHIYGRTGEQTDGRTDGQMDKQTGCINSSLVFLAITFARQLFTDLFPINTLNEFHI